MAEHAFEGEYWNIQADTPHITRLRFEERDGRAHVSAWGACFPCDCEWGETELIVLRVDGPDAGGAAVHAFATWEGDDGPTHCLLDVADEKIEATVVAIRSEIPSYRITERFRKDPARTAAASTFDPISKFQRMWDGSEPGWKLARPASEVYFVEFHFRESGPSEAELSIVREFVEEYREETLEQSRSRLQGCEGIGVGRPFGPDEIARFRSLEAEGILKLTIDTITTDDYLALTPSGRVFNWNYLREFRRPVIDRMLAAGVETVER